MKNELPPGKDAASEEQGSDDGLSDAEREFIELQHRPREYAAFAAEARRQWLARRSGKP